MTNIPKATKNYLNEENNCVKCKFYSCAKVYLAAMEGIAELGIGCDTFKLVSL